MKQSPTEDFGWQNLIIDDDEEIHMCDVIDDLIALYNIVRDGEYRVICKSSQHALGLCTTCTSDTSKSLKNIEKYKKDSRRED